MSAFLRRDSTARLTGCDLYAGFCVCVCAAAYDDLCRRPSSVLGRDIIEAFRQDYSSVGSFRAHVAESAGAGARS